MLQRRSSRDDLKKEVRHHGDEEEGCQEDREEEGCQEVTGARRSNNQDIRDAASGVLLRAFERFASAFLAWFALPVEPLVPAARSRPRGFQRFAPLGSDLERRLVPGDPALDDHAAATAADAHVLHRGVMLRSSPSPAGGSLRTPSPVARRPAARPPAVGFGTPLRWWWRAILLIVRCCPPEAVGLN